MKRGRRGRDYLCSVCPNALVIYLKRSSSKGNLRFLQANLIMKETRFRFDLLRSYEGSHVVTMGIFPMTVPINY